MNQTHIHLLLNHVSILAAVFSVGILIVAYLRDIDVLKKTAMIGFVLAALVAIPVFLTGEPAEDSVEKLPGVLKSAIDEHEESAELSIWLIGVLGVMSLAGLVLGNRIQYSKKYFLTLLLFFSFVAAGSISYTGYLGGKIRHSEISNVGSASGSEQGGGKEEGDDD